jgi:hypothetical protein
VKRILCLVAAVAAFAAGCGSSASNKLYTLQKTTACLRSQNLRLGGQLDFVATTATGGATRAHFGDGNFVTIVFGATFSDADNITEAYERFHGKNVGIGDVLRQQNNVVMLWHEHPSDADLATTTKCLK